jgi:Starch-binding associating with outer membrane/Susd and RagB outer membrane lipoprotein
MKQIKYIFLLIIALLGNSCSLDQLEDPNAVQPSNSLPNLILNSMQRTFAATYHTASVQGMSLTRLQNSGGALYNDVFIPQSFDGIWSNAYAGLLQDGQTLIADADARGFARHAGIARVFQAYTLMLLVDWFGDVPYSDALKGSTQFNPKLDKQADLYNLAITILDKAILDLTTTSTVTGGYLSPSAPVVEDLYYGGTGVNQFPRWARLANTLKLKLYLNLRLINAAGATTGINAAIASPVGLISTPDENFVYRYGSNLSDPDNRHPLYVNMYPAGGGDYMSNWLMWHMFHGYDATSNGATGDPRMRFYFYRQVSANSANTNLVRCAGQLPTIPANYPQSTGSSIILTPNAGMPPGIALRVGLPPDPAHPAWGRTFCFPSNVGYWGRDHLDPQGIPPDNFSRTAWGAYPAGGRFDNNVNASVGQTQGMRGAGFQPIMMRSFVQFMRAEAANYLGTTGVARTLFRTGMENSFDDVRNWSLNGQFGTTGSASTNENATITAFYPAATYTTDRDNYVNSALVAYDAQLDNDGRMNYIAREYWISLFGNGVEAYNLYRRTGMPSGMQPTVNPSPGGFVRSNFYPAAFATRNNNVVQKTNVTTKIFWDTNTSNLDF